MKLLILCSILFLAFSCQTPKQVNTQTMPASANTDQPSQFDKQGHRGCRGLRPENTIPAMKTALDLGVTTLEMDVVITKDKKVVLSHEPWFDHQITTKPDGATLSDKDEKSLNIFNMTYEEVQRYDVGKKVHPKFPDQLKMPAIKPLLSEVFDSVRQYMMTSRRPFPFYNIETKSKSSTDGVFHPAPAEFVELLMGVIREKGMEEMVIIQSFDFRTLQYLHKAYPAIRTAMLVDAGDNRSLDQLVQDLGFVPTIHSPHYSLLSKKVIEACHQKGMKVIPWTVNDKGRIEKLKAMGVDGIITDYPNLFNE
jgi:glycerophosphoryl diester phosphodiesterase